MFPATCKTFPPKGNFMDRKSKALKPLHGNRILPVCSILLCIICIYAPWGGSVYGRYWPASRLIPNPVRGGAVSRVFTHLTAWQPCLTSRELFEAEFSKYGWFTMAFPIFNSSQNHYPSHPHWDHSDTPLDTALHKISVHPFRPQIIHLKLHRYVNQCRQSWWHCLDLKLWTEITDFSLRLGFLASCLNWVERGRLKSIFAIKSFTCFWCIAPPENQYICKITVLSLILYRRQEGKLIPFLSAFSHHFKWAVAMANWLYQCAA